jgi:FkbM family methyltransferase
MDVLYKWNRILRFSTVMGLLQAIRFELLWTLRVPEIKICLPGYPAPLVIRRWNSDLSVFESTFFDGDMGMKFDSTPRLIIDGGANVGYTTARYAHSFPTTKVIAVEPSRENLQMLRANTAGFDNIIVVEGALWSHSGHLRISNPLDLSWAFRVEPATVQGQDTIQGYTIMDVMRQGGAQRADLVKLDVEGAEEQLFSEGDKWFDHVNTILVEIHGEKALSAVKDACRPEVWSHQQLGEKLLLVRKTESQSAGAANTTQAGQSLSR